MKNGNFIFFIGGAILGALGGFFGAKTHYEKVYKQYAEETVNEMKQIVYGVPEAEEEISEEQEEEINPVKWTKEREAEVRKRLERNRQGTNYAALYGSVKTNIGGENDDDEDSEDDSEDPEDAEADGSETEDPELEAFIQRREAFKGRKPHLISADKAADLPAGIDMVELQFYDEDAVLVDGDTEEPITDIRTLVGDCLTKYDFAGSDEKVIYVQNDDLDTVYEIIKVNASYEETHPED